jgi:hypothetical protein
MKSHFAHLKLNVRAENLPFYRDLLSLPRLGDDLRRQ